MDGKAYGFFLSRWIWIHLKHREKLLAITIVRLFIYLRHCRQYLLASIAETCANSEAHTIPADVLRYKFAQRPPTGLMAKREKVMRNSRA